MSQSQDRADMISEIEFNLPGSGIDLEVSTGQNELSIGHPGGYEVLLPKYSISTGRDGDTESVSQARIYMDEAQKWYKNKDFKFGKDVEVNGKSYVGFLLSAVQENRAEKVQTTPLNGDNFATTFYGEAPSVYAFQGILYNTEHARWREIFSILYKNAFRGSQISRHRKLLHIVYDNKIVSGWMLNLSQSISATSDTMANFTFQFLVRSEFILATEMELSYNNAYFTGAPVPSDALDALADLPEYDDYLNVARIKPPPKRQRGVGGKKRSAYACLPGKGSTKREGKTKKANTRFNGQNIRGGGPTSTDCDVSRAALSALRQRNSEIDAAKKKYPPSKDSKNKNNKTNRQKAISTANQRAQNYLSQTTADLSNIKNIEDKSARTRAKTLEQWTKYHKGDFTSVRTLEDYTPEKVAQLAKAINETKLDYATTAQAKQ